LGSASDGTAPKRPREHRVGATAPTGQNEPTGHGKLQGTPSPSASLKVPAAQSTHACAPARLNRPCPHCTAVGTSDPAGHMYPAAHGPVQAEVERPGRPPYRPASHSPEQMALNSAATAPYRPCAQSVHALAPAALYFPGTHSAAVALTLPATQ
jgi:hypothetical protein